MQAFAPGIAALDEFPYKLWSRLAAHTWRVIERDRLSYGDPLGYRPLREAIANYLRVVRGMNCEPEQVIIMTSMLQTLALVSKLVLNPGEPACVEDPCHPTARRALTDAGALIVPVAVDQYGLSVERLANDKQGGQHARLVYVTPSHQYPLGVTMSLSRRLALLQWAARTGAWILEDDYDSEYRYAGRPLAALQGLDQAGCVLYMGTFSKVLFPALRLSYLVVPKASCDLFARGRAALERQAPIMEQVVLTAFFNEGHFARHLRRMNRIYQERQAALIEAVRQKLAGELEIKPTSTGMHVMGWLSPGVDDRHVWQLAMARGVDVPPLSAHALRPQPRGGLVLGYACVSPPEIRAGVDQLALALEAMGQERKGR
jgi:GntR family transcriptional regulator / MocR family aminotransferase